MSLLIKGNLVKVNRLDQTIGPQGFFRRLVSGSAGLSRLMHRQVTDSCACTVGVCETDRGSGATLLLRREGGRGVVSFLSCLAYIT